MNQEAIGKFISTCQKDKGLTQIQLAEKLNITNRAVSKWETGKSCPDFLISSVTPFTLISTHFQSASLSVAARLPRETHWSY